MQLAVSTSARHMIPHHAVVSETTAIMAASERREVTRICDTSTEISALD